MFKRSFATVKDIKYLCVVRQYRILQNDNFFDFSNFFRTLDLQINFENLKFPNL